MKLKIGSRETDAEYAGLIQNGARVSVVMHDDRRMSEVAAEFENSGTVTVYDHTGKVPTTCSCTIASIAISDVDGAYRVILKRE